MYFSTARDITYCLCKFCRSVMSSLLHWKSEYKCNGNRRFHFSLFLFSLHIFWYCLIFRRHSVCITYRLSTFSSLDMYSYFQWFYMLSRAKKGCIFCFSMWGNWHIGQLNFKTTFQFSFGEWSNNEAVLKPHIKYYTMIVK